VSQDESTAIKGLDFQLAEDGRTLQAIGGASATARQLNVSAIKAALAERGFAELFLNDHALADVIEKYNAGTAPFTLNMGERRDGTAIVTIAPDKMSASVTITTPCGGKPVDRQQVDSAIQAAGVIRGVQDHEIDAALALGEVNARPIAQGKPPEHGHDAAFRSLIPDIRDRRPSIDEHGISNYRELDQFLTVAKGDPLMQRIPATAGSAGESVLGDNIPAKPGRDTGFALGLKGAAVDAQDSDLLVASNSGQAILVRNGVSVEPVITVKNVDLSSGNLDFDGSIHVANDVVRGMKIKATGDVIIGGTVEASEIEADGDISIRGGILGRAEACEDPNKLHRNTAYLRCGGSLSARFIEHAWIEAGNCITVESEVKGSVLAAINRVVVGKKNAKKGHIIGGVTRATLLVQAIVAGSPAGVLTKIEVGVNPLIKSRLAAVARRVQAIEKLRGESELVIDSAAHHHQPVSRETLKKTRLDDEKYQLDIANCVREQEILQAQLNLANDAKVNVVRRIYGGVQVCIGRKVRLINDERIGGAFQLRNDEVFIGDT